MIAILVFCAFTAGDLPSRRRFFVPNGPLPRCERTAPTDPELTFMTSLANCRVVSEAGIRTRLLRMQIPGSRRRVEQRFRRFEVLCGEAFGEPAVDRGQEVAGFGVTALVAAEPGEAHGGAQFPEFGFLLLGNVEGFAIQFLGGVGMPLPQQQLAFVPV
jgi:hypothetical protein